MNKKILFLGSIFCLLVLSGCGKNTPATNEPINNTQTSPTIEKESSINIPNLVGKNIDEVVKELKSYIKNDSEPKTGQAIIDPKDKKTKLWTKVFKKGDQNITSLYNVDTREVVNFFVSSDKKEADKNYILKISQINSGDTKYSWSMITKPDKTFSGILIVPKK